MISAVVPTFDREARLERALATARAAGSMVVLSTHTDLGLKAAGTLELAP